MSLMPYNPHIAYESQRWIDAANRAYNQFSKLSRSLPKSLYKSRSSRPSRPPSSKPYRANRVGYWSNTPVQRTNTHASVANNRSTKTLYNHEVSLIARTTSNNINERQRDIVKLLRVKIDIEYRNTDNVPHYYRVALIAPKTGKTVSATDFYQGTGDSRGHDFGSNNALTHKTRAINPDLYTVYYDRSFIIASQDENDFTYLNGSRPSYLSFSKMIKCHRRLKFEGSASTDCVNPVYLVTWTDRFQSKSTDPVEVSKALESYKTTLYWSELN